MRDDQFGVTIRVRKGSAPKISYTHSTPEETDESYGVSTNAGGYLSGLRPKRMPPAATSPRRNEGGNVSRIFRRVLRTEAEQMVAVGIR
jgi:hypothetical protein